jgi:hypothetical protein
MPLIPSLKDFESLDKLSLRLMLPFFAVACLIQPPRHLWRLDVWPFTPLIPYLYLQRPLFWHLASMLLLLFIYGLLSALTVIFVTIIIHTLGECLEMFFRFPKYLVMAYYVMVATPFLSFGLLALAKLTGHDDPVPALNLFWELAFFSYGVFLMQWTTVIEH